MSSMVIAPSPATLKIPVTGESMACARHATRSASWMKTNGDREPATASSRRFSNSAVIWLFTDAPRMVPTRKTTCSSAGCEARRDASISSTSRLCQLYANASLPRTASVSVSHAELSA